MLENGFWMLEKVGFLWEFHICSMGNFDVDVIPGRWIQQRGWIA